MSGAGGARRFIDRMDNGQNPPGPPPFLKAAFFGQCPRCHARSLFGSQNIWQTDFAPRCGHCGLDFDAFPVGGRAMLLAMMPMTLLIILLALWLHDAVSLPFWFHLTLWLLLTPPLTLLGSRMVKAALFILAWRRKAADAAKRA